MLFMSLAADNIFKKGAHLLHSDRFSVKLQKLTKFFVVGFLSDRGR